MSSGPSSRLMWVFDYDAELYRYQPRLQGALEVRAFDHVLDIGCGTGQITRAAARAAVSGSALGVDVSTVMLARARRARREEGVTNVRFLRADAQTHAFRPEGFDLGVSRFGTMFFHDPVAAFNNIARALRPGGRLVQLVWQRRDLQEWHSVIRDAFGREPTPGPAADPFSLADPTTVHEVLNAAGFTDVNLTGVQEPVYYGPDAETALDAMLALRATKGLLAPLDPSHAAAAMDQLRASLAARQSRRGVHFDSCSWLITARRP
jgi:ubiquinone/menaquinone biosynthesis C-methylase UbiE